MPVKALKVPFSLLHLLTIPLLIAHYLTSFGLHQRLKTGSEGAEFNPQMSFVWLTVFKNLEFVAKIEKFHKITISDSFEKIDDLASVSQHSYMATLYNQPESTSIYCMPPTDFINVKWLVSVNMYGFHLHPRRQASLFPSSRTRRFCSVLYLQ